MARTGATDHRNPGRRSDGTVRGRPYASEGGSRLSDAVRQDGSALERTLYAVLAVDGLLAIAQLYVHARLRTSDGAYTSFCNVNADVNCDAVLASPYASLLGVPVAAWGLGTYIAIAVLIALRKRSTEATRERITLALLALAGFTFVFSVYMALIAALELRTLCLLCAAQYVLNAFIPVLVWRLGGPGLTPQRAVLGAGGIAAMVAVVAAIQLVATGATLANLTPDEVRTRDPEFYRWYTTRPVVDLLPVAEHVRGAIDAPVTIVEFSDFECAFCAKAFRDLEDLERRHRGSVKVVFHHFPLDSACNPAVKTTVHESACLAAIAAECAARYGKFWEYHDRLFGAQDRLGHDDLIATAEALGIDRATFVACLDDPQSRADVRADAEAGARLGIKSTPTLFINGRAVEGALERNAYDYVIAMERKS